MESRRRQNIIAAVVLLVGMVALLEADHIWDWWRWLRMGADSRPVVAEINEIRHNVRFRLPESLTYFKARPNQGLRIHDTISTDAESSAVISFKSGLKIELQPNSLIIIEDPAAGGTLEVSFLRGGIKVLNEVPNMRLKPEVIKKEQARVDLTALQPLTTPTPLPLPVAPKEIKRVDLAEKKEAKKKKVEVKAKKESLPDSYIVSVIKSQKPFLNRCYAQHLRLNPDARGRIDTSLTIEPDGTISSARVIGSTIPDPTLQQCVINAILRSRFKSYSGDPIIFSYPINFE